MTEHTPGRWERIGNYVYALNADGVNRFYLHVQAGFDDDHNRTSDAELHAIASLIATAPVLLAALEGFVNLCFELPEGGELPPPMEQIYEHARAMQRLLSAANQGGDAR